MIFRKAAIAAIIAVFSLGAYGLNTADGITKRVRFAKGRSSVTLSNSVIRGDRDTYILGAKAGQRMTVRVTALENNAAFQIERPNGEYLQGAGEMDDATGISRRLPESGDYRIVVGGTRGNVSYKLTISIR
jgi:hypothetical protein